MPGSVDIRAGARALQLVRDGGLSPSAVTILAGASGGPKWLVLAGMDRLLPSFFAGRREPLHFVGSSIGSWRAAALASKDPASAVERFIESYIAQRYDRKPAPAEVTAESVRILDAYFGAEGPRTVLTHPYLRLSMIAIRSKGIGAREERIPLALSLVAAAAGNLASRRALAFFFDRVIFHDPRSAPPLGDVRDFPPVAVPLSAENMPRAIMASGSIPLVMSGVRDIPGAPAGTYRDGGIIDYHLDLPFAAGEGRVVLYPHFFDRITPGWFDNRPLPRRRPLAGNMADVVLVSPSREFVASLPGKRVPDRDDFMRYRGDDAARFAAWREIAARSREPAEEFMEAVESGRIRGMARPLECRQG